MVLQLKIKLSSSRIIDLPVPPLLGSIRMVLLLSLLLVYELSSTVEAKALPTKVYNMTVLSKTGRYLTIGKQGITGETTESSYAKVDLHTVGFNGKIAIKAVKMQKYLAMDRTGKVYLAASATREAVFTDNRQPHRPGFSLIRSQSHPSKYLAISELTGSVSGSTNTTSDDTSFAFLPAS